MKKTNAMRMLDVAGIPYEARQYEWNEDDLSGLHAARLLSLPAKQVFKTLLVRGERTGLFVCCIPAGAELDLKKAAAAAGDKRAEMTAQKELLPLTGYVRGGCSPIGMKKEYPTLIDDSARDLPSISVSGGARGLSLVLDPNDLINYLGAKPCALTKE